MKKERKANNLDLLRFLHGHIDQNYVAKKLNISQPYYSKLESGEKEPSPALIKKLEMFYNCDIHCLLYLDKTEIMKIIFENLTESKPSLAKRVDMKVDRTKRKFKIFINKMKVK